MNLEKYKMLIEDRIPENTPLLHGLLEHLAPGTLNEEKDYYAELRYIRKLILLAEAVKNERKSHDDCYCDCNSGSCPCTPCSKRKEITDRELENLERE
jgi:hypothetical protein